MVSVTKSRDGDYLLDPHVTQNSQELGVEPAAHGDGLDRIRAGHGEDARRHEIGPIVR